MPLIKNMMYIKFFISFISLVKDKFGNYVVQKMIEYAPEEQRQKVIEHS